MDLIIFLFGLAILFILIILLYIDYKLGRKSHLANSDIKEYPVRNCQLQLFRKGPDLFEDLFQEIKQAKKHIHVLFYIAKNDEFSKKFYSLLEIKAREGLEVRLLLDLVGSFKLSKQTIAELEAANVKFSFSNVPTFPFLFYKVNARNHRKITVIDGKIGYLGGFNIGKEYVDQDSKLSPWRDYHLKLTGDIVHDLQMQFLHDWTKATKTSEPFLSNYFPSVEMNKGLHTSYASDSEMGELFQSDSFAKEMNNGSGRVNFSPSVVSRSSTIQAVASVGVFLEDLFSKRIRNAKTSIFIGTPYFIPSKKLFFDLLDAAKRGVKITILVPYVADHFLVQEASYWYFRRLLKEGVEVYQFMNGFYHAKALVFDETVCDIGTTNFDQRSLLLNYEIICFITDKETISKIRDMIDQDLKTSKKMTMDDLKNVSLMTKFKEAIAKPLEPFL
jgi:cardiolipin synthase A/B